MPLKTIEKTIGSHDVKITQFAAIRGFKLKARLAKILLPVLSPLAGNIDAIALGRDALANMDLSETLPKALMSLAETIDEEKLLKLIQDLLSEVRLDGIEVLKNFNEVFAANYNLMYQLVFEVVVANNFFDLSGIGTLLEKPATETISPKQN